MVPQSAILLVLISLSPTKRPSIPWPRVSLLLSKVPSGLKIFHWFTTKRGRGVLNLIVHAMFAYITILLNYGLIHGLHVLSQRSFFYVRLFRNSMNISLNVIPQKLFGAIILRDPPMSSFYLVSNLRKTTLSFRLIILNYYSELSCPHLPHRLYMGSIFTLTPISCIVSSYFVNGKIVLLNVWFWCSDRLVVTKW